MYYISCLYKVKNTISLKFTRPLFISPWGAIVASASGAAHICQAFMPSLVGSTLHIPPYPHPVLLGIILCNSAQTRKLKHRCNEAWPGSLVEANSVWIKQAAESKDEAWQTAFNFPPHLLLLVMAAGRYPLMWGSGAGVWISFPSALVRLNNPLLDSAASQGHTEGLQPGQGCCF